MIDTLVLVKLAFAVLMLLAAYSDARRLLIPNIYPAAVILLGLVAWAAGFPFSGPLWSHLVHFVTVLAVGLVLFHFRWFGGGDVKLYAAVALWFALDDGAWLLFITGISGVVIVIVSMTARLVGIGFGPAGKSKGRLFDRRIAYGVAIAAGGIASLLRAYP